MTSPPEMAPVPDWLPSDRTIQEHFGKSLFYSRYKIVLTRFLSALLPPKESISILDVGAGDGLLGAFFMRYRPDTEVQGLETFVRVENPPIRLQQFDGCRIPFGNNSWDVVLFSNVLHHTAHQRPLLAEALRVGRRQILIKDHVYDSNLGRAKLLALDLIGNLRFGVATTANYLRPKEWEQLFRDSGISLAWQYNALDVRAGLFEHIFQNELEVVFNVPLPQP
jgi:SAM-dependent methyltransferase